MNGWFADSLNQIVKKIVLVDVLGRLVLSFGFLVLIIVKGIVGE